MVGFQLASHLVGRLTYCKWAEHEPAKNSGISEKASSLVK